MTNIININKNICIRHLNFETILKQTIKAPLMKEEQNPNFPAEVDVKQDVTLIHGSFDCTDADEILMSLIDHKIQHHVVKNLSSHVRYGVDDNNSIKRLAELRADRIRLAEIIENARINNQNLQVEAVLHIHPIEKKKA